MLRTPPTLVAPTAHLDVVPTIDNLVALSDELCARSFSLSDDVVTFSSGPGEDRWQGRLGARGIVRLPQAWRT